MITAFCHTPQFSSTRDRRANVIGRDVTIDPQVLAEVAGATDAPVVAETPSGGQGSDTACLREELS